LDADCLWLKDLARDLPMDQSRDLGGDLPRDPPRDLARDLQKDLARDLQKDQPRDLARDRIRDLARDRTRDHSRDMVRDLPRGYTSLPAQEPPQRSEEQVRDTSALPDSILRSRDEGRGHDQRRVGEVVGRLIPLMKRLKPLVELITLCG
jgi:hypothetical protein